MEMSKNEIPNPRTMRNASIHAISAILLVGLWLYPWVARLKKPNIVLDDVARIDDLQTLSLGTRLVRPFNEHLAPWFEIVSSLTWELIGGRLELAPLGFTLASYIPFLGCLGMLWTLGRRELGSKTAGLLVVSLFAATPIFAECVYWYSASSFTWALFFTLAALWFAGRACVDKSSMNSNLVASALCCLVSPASSAIGLLSGPLCVIRIWTPRTGHRFAYFDRRCLWPIGGAMLYLSLAMLFRYQGILSQSIQTNGSFREGLVQLSLAPSYLLLTGYLGMAEPQKTLPIVVLWLVAVVGIVVAAIRFRSGTTQERRWILISAAMILLGYGMIYCVRARLLGEGYLLRVQRYHLYPCAGLALLLTVFLADRCRKLDRWPLAGIGAASAVSLGLILANGPLIRERVKYFSLQSDQKPALRLLDRMAAKASELGLSRTQVIQALDPIEPRWSFESGNILRLMRETSNEHRKGVTDEWIRSTLLSRLSDQERSELLSCVNLTTHLRAEEAGVKASSHQTAELINTSWLRPKGKVGFYDSTGWPAFLEFSLPAGIESTTAFKLSGLSRSTTWELWWAGDRSDWSHRQIVVLRPSTRHEATTDWELQLSTLPGLVPSQCRRVRLVARSPGEVSLRELSVVR